MSTLAEFMILSGGDNRPPMLEKHLYDSWKSRMELYMQNREHERMILESVDHGPLIWPTIQENRLPSDVYSFVNHHRVAKDLWERVQLLMQGTSLTKQEMECKLYDAFDKFAHIKGESLHYLPPEWSKIVTDVKLVRDLHTTKFDQLHAYLEQHELHANEVHIMCERNQDLLALVIDSGLAVPVFKQRDEHIDAINKMMSFLTTVVTSHFPSTNNQLRNSSNPKQQATTHDGRVTVQPVQGRQNSFTTREGHTARQCLKPKRKRDATWFRDIVLLVEAQGYGKVLNEEELTFLADPKVAEGPVTQTVITYNAVYQADDLDAYDSYYDDISTAKAVLMANLSSFGSDVLSEVPHSENTHNDMLNQSVQEIPYSEETYLDTNSFAQQDAMILSMFEQLSNQVTNCNKVNKDNLIANESLSAELERYKERVKLQEERQNVDLKTFNVLKNKSKEKETKNIDKEIALEKKVKELDNIKAQQIRPMLYDGSVIAKETNVISIADSEETMMLEGESRSKMLLKQKLSDEQAFWLQTSHPNTDQSASSSVKIEVPQELPKVNLVNASLKKLKYHLGQFDTVAKKRTTPDALTEWEWGSFKCDMNTSVNVNSPVAMNDSVNYVEKCNKCLELKAELIKQHNMVEKDKNNTSANQTKPAFDHLFELNNLKANLQAKDTTIKKLKENIKCLNKTSTTNSVKNDIDEIETINIKLEHRVAKLITENEHLKQTYKQLYDSIKPSRVRAKEHEKVFVITTLKNDLRKLKRKDIVDNAAQVSNAISIALGLYKIDLVTLAPKDRNNRETHIYYIKHTMEQAAILREILLGYARDTCPDIHKPSEKLVVVTPINKKKTVRSKSTDNTKNDRILQISSSTQKKNKVEDHSRIVKSCLNKANCVVEPFGNANVQHSKLNTNSELMCVKCNSSMFDARHELCFLAFVSDMNACSKSKSVKKAKKKEEWKPIGKVFTKIGYNWRPTGRTFTLVGNACLLTRITATNKVPFREPTPLEVVAQEPVVTKVYTRRPKVVQIVLWYLDSGCSKHMTRDRSQLTNFVYKFLGTVKFGNDHITKIMGYGDFHIRNVTISRVYYVEGLGHNLFSVGQLYDSDLEVAFRKHTCFVRNLEGVYLLSGSWETNLYTFSIGDIIASSPICLLFKASKTKSWLWH
ncbi:hypothetical protein Tco_0842659 [Tanacetum coccineum]|uniref:Retrovirus-related Pol polyprotein from transposon TNT 1-94-like beta-barrel domain-containing protein n=1 Tax=Tanacetum coccineum TaxID=301880 RepID=A0ABQ5B2L4_9ASTR